MENDLLSDTLLSMQLKTFVTRGFQAGGEWGVEFPAYKGIKLNVITKGKCKLQIEHSSQVYSFKEGDCFLLSGGTPFLLASDIPIANCMYSFDLINGSSKGNESLILNGGGDFNLIGAMFQFDGHFSDIIFRKLPSIIDVPRDREQANVLKWSLEQFSTEFHSNLVGRSLILNHLAPIMLLQIFRLYLLENSQEENWLFALADPKLSKALEALHSQFDKKWSLDALAKVSGMSRSSFALNFKKKLGTTPINYQTCLKIHHACYLLHNTENTITQVSQKVGYESESAFSTAFKKVMNCRPGYYKNSKLLSGMK